MFNKKIVFLLIVLFFFAFSIRIYQINTIPLGIHPDEASWGYNAYSILMTGKDEHGISYPLVFQAFGDQKLPAYIYLLVPFIKTFGLGSFSVRFPSVIIGSIITLLIFLLLKQFKFSTTISFIGSLIASTSPWQIILSRIWGYDSNLGLMFFLLGIIFFFLFIKKNRFLFLIISSIAFGLTWYCYIAYQLISTLILLSLVFIYFRKKLLINHHRFLFLTIFFTVISPLVINSFSGQGMGVVRFNQVISTPNLGMVLEINENRSLCIQKLPKILCYLNSNKLISYSTTILYRYIKAFSPIYLFTEGELDDHFIKINNYGLFNLISLPFYLISLIYFFNRFIKKTLTKNELFAILGLIISVVPALLVNEPQRIRLSGAFPFLIIFLTFGISQFYFYLKKAIDEKILSTLLISAVLISFLFFMINFLFVHIQKYETEYRTYVVKLMQYLGKQSKDTQIYIKSIDEGIILYSFINKINPYDFQKYVIRQSANNIGFVHATDLKNIHLTNKSYLDLHCQTKKSNQETLYVTNDNLINTNEMKQAKKIIFSEDKTYKLMFVYSMKNSVIKNVDCKSLNIN